jgi:hypothetical protein
MKVLKKIAVTLVMTASMLAVSSTTFAAAKEHVDLNAVVELAGKNTEASLLEAKSLLEKGGSTDQIAKALNDARQYQKEFRYEQTERLRQKLNDQLSHARKAFDDNNNEKALDYVNKALALYAEMKVIYDKAHKQ